MALDDTQITIPNDAPGMSQMCTKSEAFMLSAGNAAQPVALPVRRRCLNACFRAIRNVNKNPIEVDSGMSPVYISFYLIFLAYNAFEMFHMTLSSMFVIITTISYFVFSAKWCPGFWAWSCKMNVELLHQVMAGFALILYSLGAHLFYVYELGNRGNSQQSMFRAVFILIATGYLVCFVVNIGVSDGTDLEKFFWFNELFKFHSGCIWCQRFSQVKTPRFVNKKSFEKYNIIPCLVFSLWLRASLYCEKGD